MCGREREQRTPRDNVFSLYTKTLSKMGLSPFPKAWGIREMEVILIEDLSTFLAANRGSKEAS